MEELSRISDVVTPSDILLVADAMTGQDAVNIAQAFNQALDIGGVVLTKMDGDARGGAALSIKAITGKPIKFIGVGEKLERTRGFPSGPDGLPDSGHGRRAHPDRKGPGGGGSKNRPPSLKKKLRKNQFTLEDFRDQMVQIRKMGSLSDLLGMIPGMGKIKQMKNLQVDERELVRIEAIINSMTPQERRQHTIINGSRRKRIAKGQRNQCSGCQQTAEKLYPSD